MRSVMKMRKDNGKESRKQGIDKNNKENRMMLEIKKIEINVTD